MPGWNWPVSRGFFAVLLSLYAGNAIISFLPGEMRGTGRFSLPHLRSPSPPAARVCDVNVLLLHHQQRIRREFHESGNPGKPAARAAPARSDLSDASWSDEKVLSFPTRVYESFFWNHIVLVKIPGIMWYSRSGNTLCPFTGRILRNGEVCLRTSGKDRRPAECYFSPSISHPVQREGKREPGIPTGILYQFTRHTP